MTHRIQTAVQYLHLLAGVIATGLMTGCASWTTGSNVLYGGPADEASILRIPCNVDVRSIDGTPVSKGIGQDELLIQISPGQHRAEVRYSSLFPDGNEIEKVTSDYYAITFCSATGEAYRVTCDDPRTLPEARRLARKPAFAVAPIEVAHPVTIQPPPASPAVSTSVLATSPDRQANETTAALRRLWDQATPAERQAFLDSMNAPRHETTKPVPAP